MQGRACVRGSDQVGESPIHRRSAAHPAFVRKVEEDFEGAWNYYTGTLGMKKPQSTVRSVQRLGGQPAACSVDVVQAQACHDGFHAVRCVRPPLAGLPGTQLGIEIVTRQTQQSWDVGCNAGHGLTTTNLPDLFSVPHLMELNIGHHLVSRALTVGLREAVREMLRVMEDYKS